MQVPKLKMELLVLIGFLPQFLAFFFRPSRRIIPDNLAAAFLISSQVLLLIFALANYDQPGFKFLGLGLLLNLLVISVNGGLMPISPEVVEKLVPDALPGTWEIGARLGTGKDVVLPVSETRLWWLSDRFLLPDWFPYTAAYSVGDIFIAVGAYWLLWAAGGPQSMPDQTVQA